MTDWSSGYVTEITYTYGMYRELVPALLGFALMNAGLVGPDMGGNLAYCELGCGQGLSANLLAASNPNIEFHATDFNPTHTLGARDLAAAAGTPNVHFHNRAFAEFVHEPGLPDFDIIALHGVYSWISLENRRHIVDFIRARLKVGGIVYISYDAMPGWAPSMPLRRLMVDRAAEVSGSITRRIDEAFAYVERLKAVDAAYFKINPTVADSIEQIKEQNRNYVAHEYFNRDLTPFYHAEIAADLAEAKLNFACSAHLADNLAIAHLTSAQLAFLGSIQNVSERETLRDFILNQRFRRDIFVKGALPLSALEAARKWDSARFALTTPRPDIPMKIAGKVGEVKLKEEIYAPILDVLAEGPRTTRELAEDARTASLGRSVLQQALGILVGANHVQPVLDRAGEADRLPSVRAFNSAVLEKSRSHRHLLYLASAVTGSGLNVERIPQLFLLALREGHEDPPAFVRLVLEEAGHKVARDGKPLDGPAEELAELRELFKRFENRQLPLLRTLGIV